MVIASSFYKWHWLDEKGKNKEKYQIHNAELESIAFAGIYANWNQTDGNNYNSFSIVTTEANENMKYIHNHKSRMPIMINIGDESTWLDNSNDIQDFAFPHYKPRLIGFKI